MSSPVPYDDAALGSSSSLRRRPSPLAAAVSMTATLPLPYQSIVRRYGPAERIVAGGGHRLAAEAGCDYPGEALSPVGDRYDFALPRHEDGSGGQPCLLRGQTALERVYGDDGFHLSGKDSRFESLSVHLFAEQRDETRTSTRASPERTVTPAVFRSLSWKLPLTPKLYNSIIIELYNYIIIEIKNYIYIISYSSTSCAEN